MDTMKVNPAHKSDFPNDIEIRGCPRVKYGSGEPGELARDFPGQLYMNTDVVEIYIAYYDGNGDCQWVLMCEELI